METPSYKTALIVGAGEGLSASLARLFARQGIRIALAARRIEKLGALCTETGAHAFACNATEPDEVERLFGVVEREIASPDLVVYNASARARGAFVDLVPSEVAQALAVSAFGGFLVAQQAVKRMLPNQHGAILFTGASASVKGYPQSASVRDGQIRAARAGAEHGARIVATGNSRRAFRHRRRHPQRRPRRVLRQAGFDARSRRHCAVLLERAATATQRLELGTGIAAMGGEILAIAVIPGCAFWRRPGIHNHDREYGFRARAK